MSRRSVVPKSPEPKQLVRLLAGSPEMVSLSSLAGADYNPRTLSPAAKARLSGVLQRFGLVENVVVNRRSKEYGWPISSKPTVVGGHQRLEVLRDSGADQVPVVWVDLDETDERTLNLALNGDYGEWEERKLAEILSGLEKAKGSVAAVLSGLSSERVTSVLDRFTRGQDLSPKRPEGVDALEDVPELFTSGMVWSGELPDEPHVVACLDATDAPAVRQLLGDRRAQVVWCDPPYNASYDYSEAPVAKGKFNSIKSREKSLLPAKIENDDLDQERWEALVTDLLLTARECLSDDGVLYLCCTWRSYPDLYRLLKEGEWHLSSAIVWDKVGLGPGRQDYRPQYELVLYAWPEKGTHRQLLSRSESDVWRITTDSKGCYLHPTQKPRALVARAIQCSTYRGETVLDLCSGAGAALLAGDQYGRKVVSVELSPRYCDVQVARLRASRDGADER